MSNTILCGSSCVKYILKYYKYDYKKINMQMTWIVELATVLKERGVNNLKLICYNSNLYSDYMKKKDIDLNFNGFKYIQKSLSLNIPILEIKLDENELLNELNQNNFIILCVQSSIFNNKDMSGGHFVILNGIYKNKIMLINPIRKKYEYMLKKPRDIIKYCENYGSWRILIKEKYSD